jgi:hypothetical protein
MFLTYSSLINAVFVKQLTILNKPNLQYACLWRAEIENVQTKQSNVEFGTERALEAPLIRQEEFKGLNT